MLRNNLPINFIKNKIILFFFLNNNTEIIVFQSKQFLHSSTQCPVMLYECSLQALEGCTSRNCLANFKKYSNLFSCSFQNFTTFSFGISMYLFL